MHTLELSCPSDLSFLKYANLEKNTFEDIMKSQKVSMSFEDFPQQFFSIIDKINSFKNSSSSTFADLFT